jgi:carbamate kinase
MNALPGTIVVALGGNALAPPGERVTVYDQFRHTRESLGVVVELARQGWRIAIVHGNGPQVGNALERNELARKSVPPLPLGVLVASTAGWIGYMIQQSLQNALKRGGIERHVLTVITQTEIDRADRTLSDPLKPIGLPLNPERAERLRQQGDVVGEDGGGRVRRLVPSPRPIDIVEADAVRQLINDGKIVVAAGGGGMPVYRDPGVGWEGVEAVVDKDRTAAILAHRLGAATLLLLTDVDGVYRDWGTDHARRIARLTVEEAHALLDSGALARGSMAPKVEAAVAFVQEGGVRAIVAHLTQGLRALQGETGTTVTGDEE